MIDLANVKSPARGYDLRRGDERLSAHFRASEFACPGETYLEVHPRLVLALELIRRHYGRAVVVHRGGGFRTLDYQRGLIRRGLTNTLHSAHTKGLAADIHVAGMRSPSAYRDLASLATHALGMGGVGLYSWGVHVDVSARRSNGEPRQWGSPGGRHANVGHGGDTLDAMDYARALADANVDALEAAKLVALLAGGAAAAKNLLS